LSGIKEPQTLTSQKSGKLASQKHSMPNRIARVNKGMRKIYDLALRVLKPWILGIAALAPVDLVPKHPALGRRYRVSNYCA
jgi:hypothetical protein